MSLLLANSSSAAEYMVKRIDCVFEKRKEVRRVGQILLNPLSRFCSAFWSGKDVSGCIDADVIAAHGYLAVSDLRTVTRDLVAVNATKMMCHTTHFRCAVAGRPQGRGLSADCQSEKFTTWRADHGQS